MTWVLARLFGLLASLGLAAAAQAQDSNPCTSAGASLPQMLSAVPACQKDALFLATLGQKLNNEGRYLEAADHLERALMLDPSLKDAQLSYAIALTGSGDPLSAAALLDNLLADRTLPAELRTLIQRQQNAVATLADPGRWQSRITLASRVGYDSNLMGSPNLDSLSLTLAGQTVVLPLDASYLARSGSYVRADAQLDLRRNAPDGARWEAVASLRHRYSAVVSEAGSSQLDLLAERSNTATGAGGSFVSVSASGLASQTGTRYVAFALAGGWGRAWHGSSAVCEARLGGEWQDRNYLNNQVLSGRYRGLTSFLSCEQASGMQWLLGLKTGRDLAVDAARPGGDQHQDSLRLSGYWPITGVRGSGLLADFELSHQDDSSIYSELIDSVRTRSISRHAARLEYQHPLFNAMQWTFGAEKVAQSSSLALFRQDNWGVYTGLRMGW